MSHQAGPETNQRIRKKARRAGLFPMSRACQELQLRTVCQSLAGALPQGLHHSEKRQRKRGCSVWSGGPGKFLCFLIKGVTCLAESHLGWLKVCWLTGDGLLSMVLNSSCAEEPCSTCGLQTSSIGVIWELIRNAELWAPSQTYRIRICHLPVSQVVCVHT